MDHKQEEVSYFSINIIQSAALWASNSSIFSDEEVETHTSLRFHLGLINVPPSPYSCLNPGCSSKENRTIPAQRNWS